VLCGRHLLAAKLRRSNIAASAGAVAEIERIVGQIRARWPRIKILLRADSGVAREELMPTASTTSSAWRATRAWSASSPTTWRRPNGRAWRRGSPPAASQLRLWFASFAYVLLDALRRIGLRFTQFAAATCGAIRLKLLRSAPGAKQIEAALTPAGRRSDRALGAPRRSSSGHGSSRPFDTGALRSIGSSGIIPGRP
jgi:hypothetical protein